MADRDHTVQYTVKADFSDLIVKAAKARAELAALNRSIGDNTAAQVKGTDQVTAAVNRKTQADRQQAQVTQQTADQRMKAFVAEIAALQKSQQILEKTQRIADQKAAAEARAAQQRETAARREAEQQAKREAAELRAAQKREDLARREAEQQARQAARALEQLRRQEAQREAADRREAARQEQAARRAAQQASREAARLEAESRREEARQQRLLETQLRNQAKLLAAAQRARAAERAAQERLAVELNRDSLSIRGTNQQSRGQGISANLLRDAARDTDNLTQAAERLAAQLRKNHEAGTVFGVGLRFQLARAIINMDHAWKKADEGVGVFGRVSIALRNALRPVTSGGGGGNGTNIFGFIASGAADFSRASVHVIARIADLTKGLSSLFRSGLVAGAIFAGLAGSAGALAGALGAVVPVILSAANALSALAGVAATLPGFLASVGTGFTALAVGVLPVIQAFKDYSTAQNNTVQADESAARARRTASRGVADALSAVRRAEEDLTRARKDAARALVDLRSQTAYGVLDEKQAVLDLKFAQLDYNKTLKDSNATGLDREQALLRVKRAELDLSSAKTQNKRNQEDLNAEEKKGVEGSDRVKNAKENLTQATIRLADAQQSLADAQAHTTSSQNKFQTSLEKLSPSQRKFVEGIIGMNKEFEKIQRRVGEGIFGPLVGQLGNIREFLPTVNTLLGGAADSIGKLTAKGIEMVTSGPWKKDFGVLAKANVGILEGLGQAGLNLLDAFRNFGVGSLPAVQKLVDYVETLTEDFLKFTENIRASGELNDFLDRSIDKFKVLVDIVKNVVTAVFFFSEAAGEFTDKLLGNIEKTTAGWADYAKAQNEAVSPLKKFLVDVEPLLRSVTALVSDFTKAFTRAAANPDNIEHAAEIFDILRTDILPEIIKLLGQLSQTGIDRQFLQFLGDTFETLNKLVESGFGTALTGFVGILALLGKALNAIASSSVGAAVLGTLATALGALAAASIVGRFTGFFALLRGIDFLVKNRGNIPTAVVQKIIGQSSGAAVADRFSKFTDDLRRASGYVGPLDAATQRYAATLRGPLGTAFAGSVGHANAFATAIQKINPALMTFGTTAVANVGKVSAASRLAATAVNGIKTAATGLMGVLGGPWGLAITAGVLALTYFTTKSNESAQAQQEIANAARDVHEQILANNGAITDSIRLQAAKNLIDQGAIDNAKTLGVNARQLTDAYLGDQQAINDLLPRLQTQLATEKALLEQRNANRRRNSSLGSALANNEETTESIKALEGLINVLQGSAAGADKARIAYQLMNGGYAQTGPVDAATQATNAMARAMAILADKTATASDKLKALKDAQAAMNQEQRTKRESDEAAANALIRFNEALEQNKNDFSLSTRAGLANRDAVEDLVDSLQDQYNTNRALGMSEQEAYKIYQEGLNTILDRTTALGAQRDEIIKLIETAGQVPSEIAVKLKAEGLDQFSEAFRIAREQATTLVEAFGFSAGFAVDVATGKTKLDKNVTVTGNANERAFLKQYATGYATGGYVRGPGSATSDSIPARLSNGEFVVNARATSQHRPLLEAINGGGRGRRGAGGVMGFAAGGAVTVTDSLTSTANLIVSLNGLQQGAVASWQTAAADANSIWGGIANIIAGHIAGLVGEKGAIAGPIANLNTFLANSWTSIQEAAAAKWTEITGTISGKVSELSGENSPLSQALEPIKSAFTLTWADVTTLTQDSFKLITQTVLDQLKLTLEGSTESLEELESAFKKVYNALPVIVENAMNLATGAMVTGWNKITGKINEGLKAVNDVTTKFGFDISSWQIKPIDAPKKEEDKKAVKKASGGFISGPGGDTEDKIPAWLSNNEYVIRASSVRRLGVGTLDHINKTGTLPGYANGGYISHPDDAPRFASGGIAGILALAKKSGAGVNVTSTYRPGDPGHHGSGNAVDFGGYNQHKLAGFFMSLAPALLELIHTTDKGGYYVKNGRRVSAGFYGAQVPLHRNHVHVAMTAASAAKALGGKIPQIAGDLLGGLLPAFDVEAAMEELEDSYKTNILGAISGDDKKTFMGGALSGLMTKAQDKFMSFSREKAEEYAASLNAMGSLGGTLGTVVGGGSSGGAARWSSLVTSVLKEIGVFTPGNLSAVLTSIQQESGGNPNAVQNGYVDENTRSGDLAKGLNQVIGATFRSYAGKYKDKGQFDPYANIYASVRYAMSRYGNNWAARMAAPGGYADGGLVGGAVHDHGGLLGPGRSVVNNMTGGMEGILNGKGLRSVGGPQGLAALNTGAFAFANGGLVSSNYSGSSSSAMGYGGGRSVTVNQVVNALPGMNAAEVANKANRDLARAVVTGTSSLTSSTV